MKILVDAETKTVSVKAVSKYIQIADLPEGGHREILELAVKRGHSMLSGVKSDQPADSTTVFLVGFADILAEMRKDGGK